MLNLIPIKTAIRQRKGHCARLLYPYTLYEYLLFHLERFVISDKTCSRPGVKIGSDGAVAMSSINGLVGTGFKSRYRFQPRTRF